jgi:hypothetical protein
MPTRPLARFLIEKSPNYTLEKIKARPFQREHKYFLLQVTT